MADAVIDVDPRAFRRAVSGFPSGLTVITGQDSQGAVGFTCQAFFSVSLEPPLVCFSVNLASTSYPRIRDTGRFAVNVLTAGQQHLAARFAGDGDRWAGVTWHSQQVGKPRA